MTIGMNNLGKNGRLGNQMFQYSALVGIAKQCGFDFRIPEDCDLPRGFEMLHCGDRYGLIDGDDAEEYYFNQFDDGYDYDKDDRDPRYDDYDKDDRGPQYGYDHLDDDRYPRLRLVKPFDDNIFSDPLA